MPSYVIKCKNAQWTKIQSADVWYSSTSITPRNTKLLPFDSSCQDESNKLCFIFLRSLGGEIYNKMYFLLFCSIHPNFCIKLTILYILGINIYKVFTQFCLKILFKLFFNNCFLRNFLSIC